jgi:hypothetical protein
VNDEETDKSFVTMTHSKKFFGATSLVEKHLADGRFIKIARHELVDQLTIMSTLVKAASAIHFVGQMSVGQMSFGKMLRS